MFDSTYFLKTTETYFTLKISVHYVRHIAAASATYDICHRIRHMCRRKLPNLHTCLCVVFALLHNNEPWLLWRRTTLEEYYTGGGLHWRSTILEEDYTGGVLSWRRTTLEEDNPGGRLSWRRTTLEEDYTGG